jgi:ABC-type uncharacterized transport system fused permease/ATPase subunit
MLQIDQDLPGFTLICLTRWLERMWYNHRFNSRWRRALNTSRLHAWFQTEHASKVVRYLTGKFDQKSRV